MWKMSWLCFPITGANAFCDTDNNGDGAVGVGDLMNMLSVYGSDCY